MGAAQQELHDAREQQQQAAEDVEAHLRSNQVLETALADAVNQMDKVAAELESQRRETRKEKSAREKMETQHDHALQMEKTRISDLLARLNDAEAAKEQAERIHKEDLSRLASKQKRDEANHRSLMDELKDAQRKVLEEQERVEEAVHTLNAERQNRGQDKRAADLARHQIEHERDEAITAGDVAEKSALQMKERWKAISEELAAARSEIAQAEAEREHAHSERLRLEGRAHAAESSCEKLQVQSEGLERELESAKNQCTTLSFELTRANERRHDLLRRADDLNDELDRERKRVRKLQKEKTASSPLRSDDDARQEHESRALRGAHAEAESLVATVMQQREAAAVLKSKLQSAIAEAEAAVGARESIHGEHQNALKIVGALKLELKVARSAVSDAEQKEAAATEDARVAAARLERVEQKQNEIIGETSLRIDELESRAQDLSVRLAAASAKEARIVREHEMALSEAMVQLEGARSEATSHGTNLRNLETQLQASQSLVASLQSHQEKLGESLRKELQAALRAFHDAKEREQHTLSILAAKEQDLKRAQEKISHGEDSAREARRESSAAERRIVQVQDALNLAETKAASRMADLTRQLESQHNAASIAEAQTKALEQELEKATAVREEAALEWQKVLNEERLRLAEAKKYGGELKHEHAKMQMQRDKLQTKVHALEERVGVLEDEAQQGGSALKNLQDAQARLTNDLGAASMRAERAERETKELMGRFASLKSRHATLVQSPILSHPQARDDRGGGSGVDGGGVSFSSPNALTTPGSPSALSLLKSKKLQLAIDKSALARVQTSMRVLREQLVTMSHAHAKSKKEAATLRNEISSLRARAGELEASLDTFRDNAKRERARQQNAHRNEVLQLEDQIVRIQSDLDASSGIITTLGGAAERARQVAHNATAPPMTTPTTSLLTNRDPPALNNNDKNDDFAGQTETAWGDNMHVRLSDFAAREGEAKERAAERVNRASRLSALRERLKSSQTSLQGELERQHGVRGRWRGTIASSSLSSPNSPLSDDLEAELHDAEALAESARRRIASIQDGLSMVQSAASFGLSRSGYLSPRQGKVKVYKKKKTYSPYGAKSISK